MVYRDKIKELNELANIVSDIKKNGKMVSMCHGCFDLIHPGHISQFKKSKELGDYLVVSITGDRYIKKGPHRPFYNENIRAEILSSLIPIDFVIIDQNASSASLLDALKPDFYVKGGDYAHSNDFALKMEKEAVERHGGKIVFLDLVDDGLTGKYSSTQLVEKIIESFEKP
ncbi:MAG: adenylyltransferase/cytidyltransferase family protein [Nanoarchaeota archaeon]|nr:adenylyltransferase/cytidyltransferase family protein [Nanoarchaeota archaeon]